LDIGGGGEPEFDSVRMGDFLLLSLIAWSLLNLKVNVKSLPWFALKIQRFSN
jgi:hypothetical protein